MREKMLEGLEFSEKVKEEKIRLVFYQRQSTKVVAQNYGLPNVHTIANWIRVYKTKLEKGAITLPPMQSLVKICLFPSSIHLATGVHYQPPFPRPSSHDSQTPSPSIHP